MEFSRNRGEKYLFFSLISAATQHSRISWMLHILLFLKNSISLDRGAALRQQRLQHPLEVHRQITNKPPLALAKCPFRWQRAHSVGEVWHLLHLEGMVLWSVLVRVDLGPGASMIWGRFSYSNSLLGLQFAFNDIHGSALTIMFVLMLSISQASHDCLEVKV
jgi:hypothetical protein